MNVIDGQAGQIICASLIFYSLTVYNILNIIILLILAGVSLSMVLGDNGLINKAQSSVDKYQQSANNEQNFLNAIEEYIDLKAENIVTAKEIERNPKKYYGIKVTNYTAGGATWRIFYVDAEDGVDGNGKYGDGKNTVYLIADYDDNRQQVLQIAYTASTTKVREMNPTWAANRGSSESDWKGNEKAAAYLCDISKWEDYYDSNKANYVIGSPSLEMYADSYNKTHNSDSLIYRYQNNTTPGYGIGDHGSYPNNGVTTSYDAIDTAQNGIYLVYYKDCFLASPSADNGSESMKTVMGGACWITTQAWSWNRGIRPIVSLKSDFQIKIEI